MGLAAAAAAAAERRLKGGGAVAEELCGRAPARPASVCVGRRRGEDGGGHCRASVAGAVRDALYGVGGWREGQDDDGGLNCEGLAGDRAPGRMHRLWWRTLDGVKKIERAQGWPIPAAGLRRL